MYLLCVNQSITGSLWDYFTYGDYLGCKLHKEPWCDECKAYVTHGYYEFGLEHDPLRRCTTCQEVLEHSSEFIPLCKCPKTHVNHGFVEWIA